MFSFSPLQPVTVYTPAFGREIGKEEGRGFPLGCLVTGEQSGERWDQRGDFSGSGRRVMTGLCKSGN